MRLAQLVCCAAVRCGVQLGDTLSAIGSRTPTIAPSAENLETRRHTDGRQADIRRDSKSASLRTQRRGRKGGVPRARRRARGISGSARSDYESRGSALALASLISRRPPLASPNLSLNSLTSLQLFARASTAQHSTLLSVLYSSRHTVQYGRAKGRRTEWLLRAHL